ncbi:uncharacterized protein [Euwallacea similis]|uniref:uncharacterized protein n=1 Tax=Euwallacea similis TaxID=1736056 RepID=UPI00344EE36D
MYDGWYCRTIANEAARTEEQGLEESFKKKYKVLKTRFQFVVYENESFQVSLRKIQKRLLQVTKDWSSLLNQLLKHEKLDHSTSESEETELSENDLPIIKIKPIKKRKVETAHNPTSNAKTNLRNPTLAIKKWKSTAHYSNKLSDGHMTPEEVERYLQSQNFLDLIPERAPTVPTEMFSNEPLLDR